MNRREGLQEKAGLKTGMTGEGKGRCGKAGRDALCEARRLMAARWSRPCMRL